MIEPPSNRHRCYHHQPQQIADRETEHESGCFRIFQKLGRQLLPINLTTKLYSKFVQVVLVRKLALGRGKDNCPTPFLYWLLMKTAPFAIVQANCDLGAVRRPTRSATRSPVEGIRRKQWHFKQLFVEFFGPNNFGRSPVAQV